LPGNVTQPLRNKRRCAAARWGAGEGEKEREGERARGGGNSRRGKRFLLDPKVKPPKRLNDGSSKPMCWHPHPLPEMWMGLGVELRRGNDCPLLSFRTRTRTAEEQVTAALPPLSWGGHLEVELADAGAQGEEHHLRASGGTGAPPTTQPAPPPSLPPPAAPHRREASGHRAAGPRHRSSYPMQGRAGDEGPWGGGQVANPRCPVPQWSLGRGSNRVHCDGTSRRDMHPHVGPRVRAPQSADTGWGWGGRTWSTRVYTATRSPMYATCPRAPAAAAAQGGQRHDHSPPSNLQGGFKHSGAQRIPSETLGGTYGRKAWDRMGRRIRVPPGAPDPHPLLHTGPGRKSSFWNASGHRGRVVATTVAPRGVARADRCLGFCTFGGADLAMDVLETPKRKISREIKDSF